MEMALIKGAFSFSSSKKLLMSLRITFLVLFASFFAFPAIDPDIQELIEKFDDIPSEDFENQVSNDESTTDTTATTDTTDGPTTTLGDPATITLTGTGQGAPVNGLPFTGTGRGTPVTVQSLQVSEPEQEPEPVSTNTTKKWKGRRKRKADNKKTTNKKKRNNKKQ
jgi:hypothetical protein